MQMHESMKCRFPQMQIEPHAKLKVDRAADLPRLSPLMGRQATLSQPALMIYRSGTIDRPKGCVLTHHNHNAQARALNEA